MKTYDIDHLPSIIHIGYDGENNWRPNAFDCSSLLTNHPDGIITLWLLQKGETQAFPVALERDGNTVVWTPTSGELTAEIGSMQFVCVDGEDVGKSPVIHYRVDGSILPGADHPEEVPSWATQTVERAESAANRAEEAAESIDPEQIEQTIQDAVEAYLEENPITVTETDPTVPAWAKNPTKPTYTAAEVGALPADTPIPAAVTEQTVAGWGFTKNTGTYSKPSGGIPASDLTQAAQTSLGKADTALQTAPVQSVNGQTGAVTIPIPTVPQMATQTDMSDWTSGKTVDASAVKTVVSDKQNAPLEIPVTESGGTYSTTVTAEQIRAAKEHSVFVLGGIRIDATAWIPSFFDESDLLVGVVDSDLRIQVYASLRGTSVSVSVSSSVRLELPAVTASDNGKFLRVVSGAWAAATIPSAESNSFGGGS